MVEETENKQVTKTEITPHHKGKSPLKFSSQEGGVKGNFCSINANYETDGKLEPKEIFQKHIQKLTATEDLEIANEIIDRGINAMPTNSDDTYNRNVIIQALADNQPKDCVEAKLMMQESALYAQGMKYLSMADKHDMIPQVEFYMKNAIKILRLHNETIEALNKYRRGGEQKVTVQHQYVQVNDGGKAMVGNFQNNQQKV